MAKIKKAPGMHELRIAENKLSILENLTSALTELLYDHEDIWPDIDTEDQDTLSAAKDLLSTKVEMLRRDAASIANKLKHITS